MENKRVLITGASGFIGSTAVDKALELGFETWAGIRKSSSREFLKDKRIRFVDLQYNHPEAMKSQLTKIVSKHGKFHYIIHIAGLTKARHTSEFYNVNFLQTRQLVESLIEIDAVPEVFVLMSSLSVMGPGDEINYTPIKADDKPNPDTVYGKSKLKAENWIKGLNNFPYLIIRPTGVYGPRDKDYLILIKTVKRGFGISAGLNKQILSFIYSEDLVEVIFKLIDIGIKRKEYIVSDGDCYTDTEFNRIVMDVLKKRNILNIKVPLFIVKPAAYVSEKIAAMLGRVPTFNRDKYRIMKQRNWLCDISPLQQDINFKPRYRLNEGINKTIEWYKENSWL
jgi:nucleoside-diphosphate-sugar epimerase